MRFKKIEIDKFERAHWKASKRTGDALPKRVTSQLLEPPQHCEHSFELAVEMDLVASKPLSVGI